MADVAFDGGAWEKTLPLAALRARPKVGETTNRGPVFQKSTFDHIPRS